MKIIITGGGSGGHTVPAMAVADEVLSRGHEVVYLGSFHGMERTLAGLRGIPYVAIQTGKLRRYFDVQNFTDPFRVVLGFLTAWRFLRKQNRRETRVVAFGGFVSLPVVWAAFFARVPSVLHEQTSRAGLANRLCAPVVRHVALSFEASRRYYPKRKTTLTGYPLRPEFLDPNTKPVTLGAEMFRPNDPGKLILVTGGGNGSQLMNQWVSRHLGQVPPQTRVVHQTGTRWLESYVPKRAPNYVPVGQITQGMADLMKMATVIITRGGAGILSEIGHLRKPAVVVPLAHAQGNEQFHNATEIGQRSPILVVGEDSLDQKSPWDFAAEVLAKQKDFGGDGLADQPKNNSLDALVALILGKTKPA